MYTALRRLGYHPCHGTDMWADPPRNLTLWTEAMRAKYMNVGKPWGQRELDVVLGGFDVRYSPLLLLLSSPPSLPSPPRLLFSLSLSLPRFPVPQISDRRC